MSVDEQKSTFYAFRGRENLIRVFGIAREVLDANGDSFRFTQLGVVLPLLQHLAEVGEVGVEPICS